MELSSWLSLLHLVPLCGLLWVGHRLTKTVALMQRTSWEVEKELRQRIGELETLAIVLLAAFKTHRGPQSVALDEERMH